MSKIIYDFAIQAAWRGASDRQYCVEFGMSQSYYWMLREMAFAIDPNVEWGNGSNKAGDTLSRSTCFIFSNQVLAERFADSAMTLHERILQLLHNSNFPSAGLDATT